MVSNWTRRLLVALIAVLAVGGAASAESIEGMYRVEGNGPGADQAYRGRAQVKKTGATYTIVWQIGEGGHVGTGILTSDVLSVSSALPLSWTWRCRLVRCCKWRNARPWWAPKSGWVSKLLVRPRKPPLSVRELLTDRLKPPFQLGNLSIARC